MKHLPILLLIGRPASGKSEIIDFLKQLPGGIRSDKYHLANLDVIDDFPMLWTWFEEDSILSHRLDKPRLHTDDGGYFLHTYFWDLLIKRISLEYEKHNRNDPLYRAQFTAVLEFSRGSEHGGYQRALSKFSDEILNQAAILYVNVSFQESLRKNRRRFNPRRPHSILEHALPDEKLERLYRHDDWDELVSNASPYLKVRSFKLPFVVFDNQDDVTTVKSDQLADRLEKCLSSLWESRENLTKSSHI